MEQDDIDIEPVVDSEDNLDCEPEEVDEIMDFGFGLDEDNLIDDHF